jgi:uncharacterized protein YlxW (UPF0749 family)
MDLRDHLHARTGFGFLITEVQTGLTFASIALSAGDDLNKLTRNSENAKLAYDTVLRFRDRVQMNQQAAAQLEAELEKLRVDLRQSGEDV